MEGETSKYDVIIYNDDETSMTFVVDALVEVFEKEYVEAVDLMLKTQREGTGVAGTYPEGVAAAKVLRVRELAKAAGHGAFKVTMRKA